MADKKISQLTEVTSLPDGAKLYAIDLSRAEGDRDVQIAKSNLVAGNDSHINLEDYGAVADNLGDSGVDSTTAFTDAIDDLIALGGGRLYIPFTNNKRFNITVSQDVPLDYSNITIFGGGRIFIKALDPLGATGRGQLITMAANVENFTIEGIDVLVSSTCFRSNFKRGIIGSELGGHKDISILDCSLKNQTKLDTEIGVDGITFYKDVTDLSDTETIERLTISGCDIDLYGRAIYGIQLLRKTLYCSINSNKVTLQAWQATSGQTYNAIAMYGDGEFFSIKNNVVLGSGHSGIACSMCANGIVEGNFVSNVINAVEAGIEVEYKLSHGSATFMTENINVVNNHVSNCEYGIWVTERDSSATTLAPRNINIQGNIVENSIENGIFVASGISGSPNYTSRISNVYIKDNIVRGDLGGAGIALYDGNDCEISGNSVVGATASGIRLGRNSTIFPTGMLKVSNNHTQGTTTRGIYQESGQVDVIYDSNVVEDFGVLAIEYTNPNIATKITCINNLVKDGNIGIRFLGMSLNSGTVLVGNQGRDLSGKILQCDVFNGLCDNNIGVSTGGFDLAAIGSTVLGYNPSF